MLSEKRVDPRLGLYEAEYTWLSPAFTSDIETWNTDSERAEFSETEIGEASGRLVIIGAVFIPVKYIVNQFEQVVNGLFRSENGYSNADIVALRFLLFNCFL